MIGMGAEASTIGGNYELRLSYGLRRHDVRKKYQKYWFKRSKVDGGIHKHKDSKVISLK
jgi:hypothetical protein